MKINKRELEAIIKDELRRYIDELDQAGISPEDIGLIVEPDLESGRHDEANSKPRTYLWSNEQDDTAFPGWDGRRGLKAMAHGIYEKDAPKKKNCIPGAVFHDEDGKFTDPTKEKGSWSIAVDGPHSSDCKSGQGRRNSSNRSVQFTRRRCGRGPGGVGKAKYKCKDGTPSHTPSRELDEDQQVEQLKAKQAEIDCRPCWERFLLSINQANLAAKGDLMKKGK